MSTGNSSSITNAASERRVPTSKPNSKAAVAIAIGAPISIAYCIVSGEIHPCTRRCSTVSVSDEVAIFHLHASTQDRYQFIDALECSIQNRHAFDYPRDTMIHEGIDGISRRSINKHCGNLAQREVRCGRDAR